MYKLTDRKSPLDKCYPRG